MEIRNNTPQYSTPAFGMAFKKPEKVLKYDKLVDDADRAIEHFENTIYGSKKSNLLTRAIRQYKGDQQNNTNFDIEYIGVANKPEKYSVRVVNNDGKVVAEYHEETRITSRNQMKINELKQKIEESKSPVMKKIYALRAFYITTKEMIKAHTIKPKSLLPGAFRAAEMDANKFNKLELQKQANINTVKTIFDQG